MSTSASDGGGVAKPRKRERIISQQALSFPQKKGSGLSIGFPETGRSLQLISLSSFPYFFCRLPIPLSLFFRLRHRRRRRRLLLACCVRRVSIQLTTFYGYGVVGDGAVDTDKKMLAVLSPLFPVVFPGWVLYCLPSPPAIRIGAYSALRQEGTWRRRDGLFPSRRPLSVRRRRGMQMMTKEEKLAVLF